MRYIADTHVVLWHLEDSPKLGAKFTRIMDSAERRRERIGASVVSLWEIAKLYEHGRIRLSRGLENTIYLLETHPFFELLPLTGAIAVESTLLGALFPRDPFDQIIAAAARVHKLTLLTADQKILASRSVKCG